MFSNDSTTINSAVDQWHATDGGLSQEVDSDITGEEPSIPIDFDGISEDSAKVEEAPDSPDEIEEGLNPEVGVGITGEVASVPIGVDGIVEDSGKIEKTSDSPDEIEEAPADPNEVEQGFSPDVPSDISGEDGIVEDSGNAETIETNMSEILFRQFPSHGNGEYAPGGMRVNEGAGRKNAGENPAKIINSKLEQDEEAQSVGIIDLKREEILFREFSIPTAATIKDDIGLDKVSNIHAKTLDSHQFAEIEKPELLLTGPTILPVATPPATEAGTQTTIPAMPTVLDQLSEMSVNITHRSIDFPTGGVSVGFAVPVQGEDGPEQIKINVIGDNGSFGCHAATRTVKIAGTEYSFDNNSTLYKLRELRLHSRLHPVAFRENPRENWLSQAYELSS
jgi:hypothetical protein